MKGFRKYIEENIAWKTNTVDYIFSGANYIPLSTKMMDRIFGKNKKQKVFHVIGTLKNLEVLAKLQGSKKSISSFSEMDYGWINHGVQGGGGILVELDANIVLGDATDMMSRPDNQGRRWISTADMQDYGSFGLFVPIIEKLNKDLHNMKQRIFLDVLYQKPDSPELQEIITALEKKNTMFYKFDLQKFYDFLTGKEKSHLIKKYIEWSEKIFMEYKKYIQTDVRSNKLKSGDTWNEIVVNQIKIKQIYFTKEFFEYNIMTPFLNAWRKILKKNFDLKYIIKNEKQYLSIIKGAKSE